MRLRAPSTVIWSVLIVGVLAGVSILLAYLLSSIQSLTEVTGSNLESQEIIGHTYSLESKISEADGDAQVFLVDRDWAFLGLYSSAKGDIQVAADELVKTSLDHPEVGTVREFCTAVNTHLTDLDTLMAQYTSKKDESPRADVDPEMDERSLKQIRADADEIVAAENNLLSQHRGFASRDRRHFAQQLTLSIATMTLLVLVGAFVAFRLGNQQRRFVGLVESIGDGFYSLDYGWRVVYINQAALEMLGKPKEAYQGHSIFEVFPEKLGTEIEQKFRAAMRLRRAEVFSAPFPSSDHQFEFRVFPFEEGVSVFMHDITARLHAAEEIRKLNETLEQRVLDRTAQLEGFCYSIAHDMRMHIRGVSVNAALLAEDLESNGDNSQEFIHRLRQATRQMGRLVEDLLMFARNSAQTLAKTEVDLSGQANEIIERLRADVEYAKQVEFLVEPGIKVEADVQLAGVVLFNLLDNACKYQRKDVRPRVEVGIVKRSDRLVFFVRDNGVGFDEKYADRIFKPFERLHSDLEIVGSGIGLASVKRIIERHGGDIWVESRLGMGSVFYFTFSELEAA